MKETKLLYHTSDIFRPWRYGNSEKLFNSERKRLLIYHHGNIVETIEIWQRLSVCFVFAQLFRRTMKKSDVWNRFNNHLNFKYCSIFMLLLNCQNWV